MSPASNPRIQPNDQNQKQRILPPAHKHGCRLSVVPVDGVTVRIVPKGKSYVCGHFLVLANLCGRPAGSNPGKPKSIPGQTEVRFAEGAPAFGPSTCLVSGCT